MVVGLGVGRGTKTTPLSQVIQASSESFWPARTIEAFFQPYILAFGAHNI